jgi:hypothetical protein
VGKRKGRPATQAAFSSRENSSNGGKIRQNFLAKSYEPKKPRVNKIFGNKYLCFQLVRKGVNILRKWPVLKRNHLPAGLTGFN